MAKLIMTLIGIGVIIAGAMVMPPISALVAILMIFVGFGLLGWSGERSPTDIVEPEPQPIRSAVYQSLLSLAGSDGQSRCEWLQLLVGKLPDQLSGQEASTLLIGFTDDERVLGISIIANKIKPFTDLSAEEFTLILGTLSEENRALAEYILRQPRKLV